MILTVFFLLLNLAAASNLPKLTAGFGLLAWSGVFLATGGLVLFYRCSRYVIYRTFFFEVKKSWPIELFICFHFSWLEFMNNWVAAPCFMKLMGVLFSLYYWDMYLCWFLYGPKITTFAQISVMHVSEFKMMCHSLTFILLLSCGPMISRMLESLLCIFRNLKFSFISYIFSYFILFFLIFAERIQVISEWMCMIHKIWKMMWVLFFSIKFSFFHFIVLLIFVMISDYW